MWMLASHLVPVVASSITGTNATSAPNLIYVLTDDLGWNYPGFHNPEVITPTLDELARGGLQLESHYMYKYCSPSRGSLMTGRYPWNLVSVRCNLIPSTIPEGVHLDYKMLPQALKSVGYTSHHIGCVTVPPPRRARPLAPLPRHPAPSAVCCRSLTPTALRFCLAQQMAPGLSRQRVHARGTRV